MNRRHVVAYLRALEEGRSRLAAASIAGPNVRTFERLRRRDEAFAAAEAAAYSRGTEALRDEAYRRGVEGVDRPVYQGGKLVGHVREYSDDLLGRMLAARDPDFRRGAEGAGSGQPVEIRFVSLLMLAAESAKAPPAEVVEGEAVELEEPTTTPKSEGGN